MSLSRKSVNFYLVSFSFDQGNPRNSTTLVDAKSNDLYMKKLKKKFFSSIYNHHYHSAPHHPQHQAGYSGLVDPGNCEPQGPVFCPDLTV